MGRAVRIGCAVFLGCLTLAAPAMGLGEPSLVRDIRPGPDDAGPFSLAPFDGRLYFSADDGVHGAELWSSDGTEAGTNLLVDIAPDSEGSYPIGLTDAFGQLNFRATHPDTGAEPWASDGTAAGTALVTDIALGPNGSDPFGLALGDSRAFFKADDGTTGHELWVYEGPGTDATPVVDLNPGEDQGVFGTMLAVGDTVYFGGDDGDGLRLWKSNGTPAGTVQVSDQPFVTVSGMVGMDDKFFFSGLTVDDGTELWVSDGTDAGTVMLANIGPDSSSGLSLFAQAVELDGSVLFVADDGSGDRLWRTDGTPAGTDPVLADVRPVDGTLTVVGDEVYFAGADDDTGRELWRSDGTAEGTEMVADIVEGVGTSWPDQLTAIDGKLFFSANDGVNGSELWVSDGTEEGTRMVADIVGGPGGGSSPASITEVGGRVFFVADTPAAGQELWSFELDVPPVAVGDAATVVEDAGATTIPVLANDTDADGGPRSVGSVTQPAHGDVVVTGGGSGVAYRPDPDYCNEGAATDDFTYSLAPGGDTATVAVRVVCVDDPVPNPPGPPSPPGPPNPPGPPSPPGDAVGTAVANRSATVRDGIARLRLRCKGDGACQGRATLSVTVRRGKRSVRVLLGAKRFAIPAGKSKTLRIRLNRAGRSRLARSRSGRVRVKLGGSGVEPRRVVLKRPA